MSNGLSVSLVIFALAALGCGSSGKVATGPDAAADEPVFTDTSVVTATGGTLATGGTVGSGGALATGGTVIATGGLGGSGGALATGGAKGGSTGTGATGGSKGVTVLPTKASSPNCTDTSSTMTKLTDKSDGGWIQILSPTGILKTYRLTVNWSEWDSTKEIQGAGLGMMVVNPSRAPAASGGLLAFPSIFIGSYGGVTTKNSNLPKAVSALSNVYTVINTNVDSKGTTDYAAGYELWFTPDATLLDKAATSPGANGAVLKVWFFQPSNQKPRGALVATEREIKGVAGSWDIWHDDSGTPCTTYVSHTPIDALAFDLNGFIQNAVSGGYAVKNTMFLSVLFAGFEIWRGGNELLMWQYCANVL